MIFGGRFFRNESGSFAINFAIVAMVLFSAAGVALDYSRIHNARGDLQGAVDSAVLAAAHEANKAQRQSVYEDYLETNPKSGKIFKLVDGSVKISLKDGVLTGVAKGKVDLTLAALMGNDDVQISAKAAVRVSDVTSEIALVLDVSSSMIEEGRFSPMVEAAKKFVTTLASDTSGFANTTVAIVPFSSRINTGLSNTSFLRKWNGNPAVPDRWKNPYSYYSSSSYKKIKWVNGSDFAMYNGKNYYWMGCVEPRIDFTVHKGTSTKPALSSDNPKSSKFLAQDYYSQSGKSFCPPPVLPLTNKEGTLTSALDTMTSQGSTRLDAGIAGGWYSLSPKWKNVWSGGIGPNQYHKDNRKIVVFMTDGQMNTQDDASSKHFDWACEAGGDCDDYATSAMLSICDSMKADGITIYTVSYDEDADRDNMRACASGSEYSYEAKSSSGSNYITDVYENIAKSITRSALALIE